MEFTHFGDGAHAVETAVDAINAVGSIGDIALAGGAMPVVTVFEANAVNVTTDLTAPALPGFEGIAQPLKPNVDDVIAYASDLLEFIKQWVSDTISGSNTGLSADVQDDMFNLDSEREVRQLEIARAKTASSWAGQNWALPDGVLAAAVGGVELTYAAARFARSAEIRQQSLKIATERIRLAVESCIKIENSLSTYLITLDKVNSQIYSAEVSIYSDQIKAKATEIKSISDGYAARLAGYEAVNKVNEGNYTIARQANSVVGADVEAALESLRGANSTSIDAFSKVVQAKIKAMDTATTACSTLAAGYFSRVHASMTYSDSKHQAQNSSYSTSNSITNSASESEEWITIIK